MRFSSAASWAADASAGSSPTIHGVQASCWRVNTVGLFSDPAGGRIMVAGGSEAVGISTTGWAAVTLPDPAPSSCSVRITRT